MMDMSKKRLFFIFLLLSFLAVISGGGRGVFAKPGSDQPALGKPSPVTNEGITEGGGISFQQAVACGVRSNLDLLAAQYNVPLAQADELTAGLWYNPALNMSATLQPYGRNWNQTSAGGPRQFDVGLTYPIDWSLKKIKIWRSAKVATRTAEAGFQDAVRLKVLDIRSAYIDVMLAQAVLSLAEEKEVNLQRLVDLLQNRIANKDLLPLLQTRAQLAVDQAKLETRQKRVDLENAKAALAALLGRRPEASWVTTTKLRDFVLIDLPEGKGLVEDALSGRPDMIALQLGRDKALLDKKVALAQRWDNISLNMGYTSQGPVGADPDDGSSHRIKQANDWGAGLSIPLPFFDRNQGNIHKADLTISQTEKQIESKEISIRQEIAVLYNQLKLNFELIKQYESTQLKNAQIVRDAQQKLYSTGGSALLDYLDAIGAYHETLTSYYAALADYRRNTSKLNAAVGKDIFL